MTNEELIINDVPAVAQAIGIQCIVIDEDFDWSTMPRFSDLFPQSLED